MNDKSCVIGVMCWNHLPFTKQSIESILKYTDTKKHELIVVDNGSTDGTVEYLNELVKEGKVSHVIFNEVNIGIAPAINQMFDYDKTKDTVFFSNDCVAGYGWLEELQEGIYKYDKMAAASPYISPELTSDEFLNLDFRNQYKAKWWPLLRDDPPKERLNEMLDSIYSGNWDDFTKTWRETRSDDLPHPAIWSMVMYFKRDALNVIGGFDPQFVPFCHEDEDWYLRCNAYRYYRGSILGSIVHHWGMITDRRCFNDDPELFPADKATGVLFHAKWDISKPLCSGGRVPWETCKDSDNQHNLFPLRDKSLYPDIPQEDSDLWSEDYLKQTDQESSRRDK